VNPSTSSQQPNTDNPFQFKNPDDVVQGDESEIHVFGNGVVCNTDRRGYATPGNLNGPEIVVDASEGFIPLWEKNTTLRWRFQERSLRMMQNPQATKIAIRRLFGDALVAWGDAVPVKFSQRNDLWDFEIVMKRTDECDANGCVLASAFFPDSGRHELLIYPRMFTQSPQEQVETLAHEIGHIFGLRHFFANITETQWASEIFGTHSPFTIMNYGSQSQLTNNDRADLKRLYQMVWSGELTDINGTPIKLVKSFHSSFAPQ
jgi:Metallo-peptidase family M12B Reprolysin-like